MRWSGPLDELRRRYLKQQAELGGDEVILTEPMVAAPGKNIFRCCKKLFPLLCRKKLPDFFPVIR